MDRLPSVFDTRGDAPPIQLLYQQKHQHQEYANQHLPPEVQNNSKRFRSVSEHVSSNSSLLSNHLNQLSLATAAAASTPLPKSPSSSLSLLPPSSGLRSPFGAAASSNLRVPRRTTSSSSLRNERQPLTPDLKKRSSVASLRNADPNSSRPSLSRRSSSTLLSSSPVNMAAAGPPKPLVPTAASIAAENFKKEMELHQVADLQSKVVVILQDDCYGHRFSRPRTSKAALSTIVERPERIRACVLGVSAAYVRLGQRHAGGQHPPHPNLDIHDLPVPPFQVRRTNRSLALSSPAVTYVHGAKWMEDLKSMCDAAESHLALNGRELVRPHSAGREDPTAIDCPFHEGDLYLCSESLDAFQGALGGVCEGIDAVFGPNSTKRAFVCIRPPGHHCSPGHPSGFCWINNVHVGISYAAMTHGLTHAAILDFDLHHGDGSQEIAWKQNNKALSTAKNGANHKKTMIGYFSLHDINSYPCEMGDAEKVRNASVCIDNAHGQSIWNVHLEAWKTPFEFWELYENKYMVLIEKARSFLKVHTERLSKVPNGPTPKAAIFLSAGFDASEWEGSCMQRHKVNIPTDFYAKFTGDVVRMAQEESLGVDGRVISVLEGGYSDRALMSGVMSHLAGLWEPSGRIHHPIVEQINRLAWEMTDRLGLSSAPSTGGPPIAPSTGPDFETEWWAPSMLEELETLVNLPLLTSSTRPPKTGPTYFAPTQSFAAKVVTPTRDCKFTSSQEAESPPQFPSVPWATAAHELFKILIPRDRQTASCRPEELNAEATRIRRERQVRNTAENVAASTGPEENRMQLRTRKPKSSLPSTPRLETPKTRVAQGNRKSTFDAGSPVTNSAESDSPAIGRNVRQKGTLSTPSADLGDIECMVQATPSRVNVELGGQATSRPGTSTSLKSTASATTRKAVSSRSATPKRSANPKKVPPVPRIRSTLLKTQNGTSSNAAQKSDEGQRQASLLACNNVFHIDSLTAGVKNLSIELSNPTAREIAGSEVAGDEREGLSMKSMMPPIKPPRANGLHLTGQETTLHPSLVKLPDVQAVPPPVATSATAGEGTHESPPYVLSTPQNPGTTGFLAVKQPTNGPDPQLHQLMPPVCATAIAQPLTPVGLDHADRPQLTLFSPPTSAAQGKHGLTVFTSSSPIPFASDPARPHSASGLMTSSNTSSPPSTSFGETTFDQTREDESTK